MMKSRDSAEQRKKEQENILQHWQERLERRKVMFCFTCFVLINVGYRL
jgi:hypothetical protein